MSYIYQVTTRIPADHMYNKRKENLGLSFTFGTEKEALEFRNRCSVGAYYTDPVTRLDLPSIDEAMMQIANVMRGL